MDNKKILEKVKMKIAISTVKEEDMAMNKNKVNIRKGMGIAACILLSTTGVVFATNYNKIINYFGLGKGVDAAIENGYIEKPDMDYISSNSTIEDEKNMSVFSDVKTNIKINNFLMDDLNLSVNFDFEFDKSINEKIKFDNISNIEFKDLIIRDEENRIIYSNVTKEAFDEYCQKHNLQYVYGDFNENYMNNGLNNFIRNIDLEANKISLNYNMYSEGYPRSKKLNFSFSKIQLEMNESENIILTGEWNFNVDVPEKMYNRETISYKVVNCSNKEFNIIAALATDAGFEIGIIIDNMEKPVSYLQLVSEEIQKEVSEGKIGKEDIENRRNELLRTEKYQKLIDEYYPIEDTPSLEMDNGDIEDTSYIENENGEKFEKSLSPSRKQDNNFIYGNKFSYYETFELTKYDITDKLKVQIMFKGEPVIIELEKIIKKL